MVSTKKEKVILVAGYSRGGTNIVWNLFQSLNDVSDTMYEVNELFGRKCNISFFDKLLIEVSALSGLSLPLVSVRVKKIINNYSNISYHEDPYNPIKESGIKYTLEEWQQCTKVLKLVFSWENKPLRRLLRRNDASKYIRLLGRCYDLDVVMVQRNGLAVAEGWSRRGCSLRLAARWWKKYTKRLMLDRYYTARFEDIIEDPFGFLEKEQTRLSLRRDPIKRVRLAKKPLKHRGEIFNNSTVKEKQWLTKGEYLKFMDSNINKIQIDRLSLDDKQTFCSIARSEMDSFKYEC